jgi:threonine synthase
MAPQLPPAVAGPSAPPLSRNDRAKNGAHANAIGSGSPDPTTVVIGTGLDVQAVLVPDGPARRLNFACPKKEIVAILRRAWTADGRVFAGRGSVKGTRPPPTSDAKECICMESNESEPQTRTLTETSPEPVTTEFSLTNGLALGLMDGASADVEMISPALEAQRRLARDLTRSLEERLEAFEDVMDSQIGDTQLLRARNLERFFGLRQIYLKFDGGNPTGTQKDRIAFAQAMDALRRGFDCITVATCGNYGAAVALAASLAGLRCVIYIPENYRTKRTREMESYGAEIMRVPGDYEAAVEVSRARAEIDELYDANPGGPNVALQLKAYGEIAYEIYDELRDAPAVVAVPVSNGTTLAGIFKGFLSLYRRGKTSRMPRFVAGSSFGKNPIVQAYLKNWSHCQDLKPERIRETAINEPLINWHSIDGNHALEAIRSNDGWADYVSDKEMTWYARMIREREGLTVLPASTAGLAAMLDRHKRAPFTGDRYVAVLTGRKA